MPFPFALLGLGSLASTITTVVGISAVTYTAKKVYDAVTDDSSSSSSYTTGKSKEEIIEEQNEETLRKLEKDTIEFWSKNNRLVCFDSEDDFDTYIEAVHDFRKKDISLTKMKTIYREVTTDKKQALHSISWDNDKLEEMLDYPINDFDDIVDCINYDNSSYDTFAGYKPDFDEISFGQQISQLAKELPQGTDYILSTNSNSYTLLNKSSLPSKFKNNQNLLKILENYELAKQAESGLPRIAVCGFLKAGKSSLLNNLIQDTQNNTFAVGVTRETIKNKELEYNGLLFIDTPGIEANKEDTREAWKVYTTSNFLLFVHLAELPLTKQEIDVLQQLQAERKDLSKRVVMVLAQADRAGDNVDALKQEVSKQLTDALGFDFPIFPISNTIHQKGFIHGKEKLQEKSGINELNAYLSQMSNTYLKNSAEEQKANTKKYLSEFAEYMKTVKAEHQKKTEQIEQEEKELVNQFKNYVLSPAKQAYHSQG